MNFKNTVSELESEKEFIKQKIDEINNFCIPNNERLAIEMPFDFEREKAKLRVEMYKLMIERYNIDMKYLDYYLAYKKYDI